MEDKINILDALFERGQEYAKTSIDLFKLRMLDKVSDVVSSVFPRVLAFAILFVSFLFLAMGASFWLGEIFGKIYFGFFMVGGFFCIMGLILYFCLSKWIKKSTSNFIIKKVLT